MILGFELKYNKGDFAYCIIEDQPQKVRIIGTQIKYRSDRSTEIKYAIQQRDGKKTPVLLEPEKLYNKTEFINYLKDLINTI